MAGAASVEEEAIKSAELELQRWRDIMFSGNQDGPAGTTRGSSNPGSSGSRNVNRPGSSAPYPPLAQSAAPHPRQHTAPDPYHGIFDFSPASQSGYHYTHEPTAGTHPAMQWYPSASQGVNPRDTAYGSGDYGTPHQQSRRPELRASTSRSTRERSPSTVPSPDSDAASPGGTPLDATMAEEKRRRNTEASARFRQKKKQKNVNLERTISDLTGRAEELEKQADDLRRENGWLKEIVILKSRASRDPGGRGASPEGPSDEDDAPHPSSVAPRSSKGKGQGK